MKVIFLDFDGVLNGIEYVKSLGKFGVIVDPIRMELLKSIVTATDAEIVLSTSWREHWSSTPIDCDEIGTQINKIFRQYKLFIYDKTPDLRFNRTEEIKSWLANYPQVTQFVILDDAEFTDKQLISHHVKTSDELGGLMPEDALTAIRILTNVQ